MVKIALLGHGVVGSGVMDVLLSHKESLTQRAQTEIEVKWILDLRDFPDLPYADRFTKRFEDILEDEEVRIVVEVMGGLHPAFDFVKACLENGKSVVTSNKELVAEKGDVLLGLAQRNNLNFLFEASVGGGIPIIRPISQCLAANEVTEIAGILNGTTNFILTKMIREKMSFADALTLAQKLGYAERDPSADVDGEDACRKICILASLAYGVHVNPRDVYTEGIREVTLADVDYAKAWGGVIKLIGAVQMQNSGQIHILVCPMFVSGESQLAHVDDVFNGILVRGDATGDVVFYGKGAGKLPTASAVVADVIDCIKHFKARKYLFWEEERPGFVADVLQVPNTFFVRIAAEETAPLLEEAKAHLPGFQLLHRQKEVEGEAGFLVTGISMADLDAYLLKQVAPKAQQYIRMMISGY